MTALRGATPGEAFLAVKDAALAQIELNAPGALASSDPEFLHQLRVGMRRLRSALRAFRGILPRKRAKRVVRALRRLSPVLGRARDWDVLLPRVVPTAVIAARARIDREAAREALDSKSFRRLIEQTRALQPKETDEALREFAAAALERAHRKVMKQTDGIDWQDAAPRHAVRIRVKRLRYTCEFFVPAFPAKGSAGYVAALKELQTILGELNDNAVGRRLAHLEADDAQLLRRLAPAWASFEKRRPFWRAAARTPRRAAK